MIKNDIWLNSADIVLSVLQPLVRRMLFLVFLLRIFREFSMTVDRSLPFPVLLEAALPLYIALIAALTILPALQLLHSNVRTHLRRKKEDSIIKRYCYIQYGCSEVREGWNKLYGAQKNIIEYFLMEIILAIVFCFYDWRIWLVYFSVSTLSFWLAYCFHGGIKFMNKRLSGGALISGSGHVAFCFYIFMTSFLIMFTDVKLTVELIVIMIVGPKMQLNRSKRALKYFILHMRSIRAMDIEKN